MILIQNSTAMESAISHVFASFFCEDTSSLNITAVQDYFKSHIVLHPPHMKKASISALLRVFKRMFVLAKTTEQGQVCDIFAAEMRSLARSSLVGAIEVLRNAFSMEASSDYCGSMDIRTTENSKHALSKWHNKTNTEKKLDTISMKSLVETDGTWLMKFIKWDQWNLSDQALISIALIQSDSERTSFFGQYVLHKEVLPCFNGSIIESIHAEFLGFLVNVLSRDIEDTLSIKGTVAIIERNPKPENKSAICAHYGNAIKESARSFIMSSASIDMDFNICLERLIRDGAPEVVLERLVGGMVNKGTLPIQSMARALLTTISTDFSSSSSTTQVTSELYERALSRFLMNTDMMDNQQSIKKDLLKILLDALHRNSGNEVNWESIFRSFDIADFELSDWSVYEKICWLIDYCLAQGSKKDEGDRSLLTRETLERRILLHCEWKNKTAQFQWIRFAFLELPNGGIKEWHSDEALVTTLLTMGRNPTIRHLVCQAFHLAFCNLQHDRTKVTLSSVTVDMLICLFHHARGKNKLICSVLIAHFLYSVCAIVTGRTKAIVCEDKIVCAIEFIASEFMQKEYMHHTIPTDDQHHWTDTLASGIVRCARKGHISISILNSIIVQASNPMLTVAILTSASANMAFQVLVSHHRLCHGNFLREWITNTFFDKQRTLSYLNPALFICEVAEWTEKCLESKSDYIVERKGVLHTMLCILSSPFTPPLLLAKVKSLRIRLRETLVTRELFDATLIAGTGPILDDARDHKEEDSHKVSYSELSFEEFERKAELQARKEAEENQIIEGMKNTMIQQLFDSTNTPEEFLKSLSEIKRRSMRRSRDLLEETNYPKFAIGTIGEKFLKQPQAKKLYDGIVEIIWNECPNFLNYSQEEQKIAAKTLGGIILYDLFPNVSSETKSMAGLLKFILKNIAKPTKQEARHFALHILSIFLPRTPQWPEYCKHLHMLMQTEHVGQEIRQKIPTIESIIEDDEIESPREVIDATEREWQISAMSFDRRSIAKRLSMLDEAGLALPARGVRERVAFLLNNLDIEKVQSHALEIAPLLETPPTALLFFARYLVENRILTEPNYHKVYASLLSNIGNRAFERLVLSVSYCFIERSLASDSIRVSSSERSTLKNLGSWIGLITLSKDRPIITRELNVQHLLLDGLAKGKLIAFVPFIAKLLEGTVSSRVFTIQCPWVLSIFVLLVELYSLNNIKVNLRFELELLCKKINISLQDLVSLCAAYPSRNVIKAAVEEIHRSLDFSTSVDFTGISSQASSKQKSLSKSATDVLRIPQVSPSKELRNTRGTPSVVSPTEFTDASKKQEKPAAMKQNWMENLDIIQSLIPPFRVPPSLSAFLQQKRITLASGSPKLSEAVPSVIASILKLAVEVAVKEVLLPVVERSVLIATSTTKELIRKDFAFDSDDQALEKHLKYMARALASSLAVVTAKEPIRASTRRTLQSSILSSFALRTQGGISFSTVGHEDENKGALSTALLQEFIDLVLQDNKEGLGVLELVERVAGESAVNRVADLSASFADERRQTKRLLLTMGSNTIPKGGIHSHPFISTLPRDLQATHGITGLVKDIYDEFTEFPALRGIISEPKSIEGTVNSVLEKLNELIRYIETEAVRHYKGHPRKYLSLTQPEFASNTLSKSHEHIKKCLYVVPDLVKTVSEETDLLQLVQFTYKNLVTITNSLNSTSCSSTEIIQRIQNGNSDESPVLPTGALILNLIHESYLLILQSAKERKLEKHEYSDQSRNIVVSAITRLFLEDEQIWELRDLCIGFIRLRLIELPKLDGHVRDVLKKTLENSSEGLFLAPDHAHSGPPKYAPRTRLIVEFAGGLIQSCLVDEKIANQKDLQGTLHVLAEVANEAQRQQKAYLRSHGSNSENVRIPTYFSPAVTKHRAFVSNVLENWRKEMKALDNETNQEVLPSKLKKGLLMGKRPLSPESYEIRLIEKFSQMCASTSDLSASNFFQLAIESAVADFATLHKTHENDDRSFEAVDSLTEIIISISYSTNPFWRGSEKNISILGLFFEALLKVMQANHRHFSESMKRSPFEPSSGPYLHSRESVLQAEFQQQPYFRLLSNLLCTHQSAMGDTAQSHWKEVVPSMVSFLQRSDPGVFPGFTFAWVSLVFHRVMLSSLLRQVPSKNLIPSSHAEISFEWKSMHVLITIIVKFLSQIIQRSPNRDESFLPHIAMLYKNTLRGMLVILHDFPEFFCMYADSLCATIPFHFVQMRNVILSAFPRAIRLPDPFTPNLKVDMLPESSHAPIVDERYQNAMRSISIGEEHHESLYDLVSCSLNRQSNATIEKILQAWKLSKKISRESVIIPATLLSICLLAVSDSMKDGDVNNESKRKDALLLISHLALSMDRKDRFTMLNSLVDQLRYPNRLTVYCSFIVLGLFSITSEDVQGIIGSRFSTQAKKLTLDLQEQITRVLFQRLIGNRPHPWGLLITFIELVKNPRYEFWKKSYVHNSPPGLRKLFESVGHSCVHQNPSEVPAATMPPKIQN